MARSSTAESGQTKMSAVPDTDRAMDAGRGEVGTRLERWGPPLIGATSGLAVFVWLVIANRQLIGSVIIEDGDAAANAILVDKAEQFRLLVGNYSRVGFNHPGPAFLYAQAFGDMVFHRLLGVVPSSYNGQFLGILALNSACVGTACGVIRRATGRWTGAVGLLAVLPLINVWEPYALATTWMPGAYIAPFLLLLVSAASVAGGHWGHLWVLVVGASLCVHGHVSFVLFAGVTTVVALIAGWFRSRRSRKWPTRSNRLWAAATLVLFLSPIVVNLLLHWPGEFEKYISFSTNQSGFTPRTTGDVIEFVASYWIRSGWWMLVLIVAAVALAVVARLADPSDSGGRFRLDLIAICGVELLLFAIYAERGVDDLVNSYVGWFMLVCPVLVLWAGLDAILDVLGRRRAKTGNLIAGGVCAALVVTLVAAGDAVNPYRGMEPGLAAALPPGPVRLDFQTAGWPAALGLIEDARRRDQQICVVDPVWGFLVTPAVICQGDQGEPIRVLGPGEPRNGRVLYDNGGNALVKE